MSFVYPSSCWVVVGVSVWLHSLEVSQQFNFYDVGLSTPRSTPNLEERDISFSLSRQLPPVRHGRHCQ
jgi:hypothetical protein